ncbi:MAG: hypothetical protein RL748_2067 [Pseudomonadota bacterium]|jgi:hypothetical protein
MGIYPDVPKYFSPDVLAAIDTCIDQIGRNRGATTRPQKARHVKSPQLTSTSFDLTAYNNSELQEALARYAERYYRSMGQPSTLDVAQHFARIERAVAQGKPIKQICTIPLARRMLFERF